ncbi:hypothetical protein GWK48_10265 [Metallosphaera tengchongensis]|uniref:Uncharacterized protein n=1 Tax=Metallosphaera tengchongensis TaxID=1532350 RepID=A0A6N0P0B8_9CREN|nr:hypothetical protein [Metallosphaera tengchongensis]QKR00720.1 hypothetical protein GWK48_10265 [Metallosphaera tengchongensis]
MGFPEVFYELNLTPNGGTVGLASHPQALGVQTTVQVTLFTQGLAELLYYYGGGR